jgi:RND family efflux transporter MFP subunit
VEELELTGRVAAVNQQDVGFTKGGRVLRLNVRIGDHVKKGQVLAELDQAELLNSLAQAKVALEQARLALQRGEASKRFAVARAKLDIQEARAVLQQAKTEGERTLARIGVQKAQITLQEAQAITNEEAEAQVAQAQLEYNRLNRQAQAGKLVAPFDGEVSAIAVTPGASVEEFAPVMTIIDPGEREVRAENVTGSELQRLGVNQPVTLRFNRYQATPVPGVIKRLPQDTTGQTGVKTDSAVHVAFDPGRLNLDIGDLAEIVVTLQHKEGVLFLPPPAVRNFQGRQFVVVQNGDRQSRVDVEVGITSAGKVEIVSGLKEGQVVVGQ